MIETKPATTPKPNQQVEEWLTSHGVSFELQRVAIDKIDTRRSLQNQARFAPLDERLVATYSEAMAEGVRFPPVVLFDNGKAGGMLTIDGNHRITSAVIAGYDQIDAYVTTNLSERLTSVLTFDANTKHGLPTSPEERRQHAVYLVETAGISQRDAAAMLNVPTKDLTQSLTISRANRRLTTLGVDRWTSISPTQRSRLENIRNDNVFKAAAEVIVHARLGHEAVSDFVTEINKATTETDQLAVVEAERGRQEERIKMTIAGRTNLPRSVTRLSRSLAYAEGVIAEDFDKKILDPVLAERFQHRLAATIATYQAVLNRLS